jgi:hypothetical protein
MDARHRTGQDGTITVSVQRWTTTLKHTRDNEYPVMVVILRSRFGPV